jgi:hypothetical protein
MSSRTGRRLRDRLSKPANGFVQHYRISVGHGWEQAGVNVTVG